MTVITRIFSDIFSKENIKTIDKVIEKWENVKRLKKKALTWSFNDMFRNS
jgi:uncharacterized protein YabN with tetrapyrrole methylase and pyrophosphatase domain